MKTLLEIAAECRVIYDNAAKDLGPDLGGFSALDLVADNLPYDLRSLQDALVVAGIQDKKYGSTERVYERR